jgi:hypothetical protein
MEMLRTYFIPEVTHTDDIRKKQLVSKKNVPVTEGNLDLTCCPSDDRELQRQRSKNLLEPTAFR